MLVLARKLMQTIKIGDSITITIVSIGTKTVQVGIDAPTSLTILRGELPVKVSTAKESSCQRQCANSCSASSCCSSALASGHTRKTGGES